MRSNREGFSIILALGLSLIFAIVWLFVMEYIIPFSRSTANIEQATIAQYKAFSGIEQSLRLISQQDPWYSADGFISSDWTVRRVDYIITWEWNRIPRQWTWNWTHPDWNRISQTEPVQLLIWNERIQNWTFRLRFRIPDFWGTWGLQPSNLPLVLWQISSESETLSARNESSWIIMTNNINTTVDGANINLWGRWGVQISNNQNMNFWQFYNANCQGTNECVLRVSIINPLLQGASSTQIPFIEYQVRPWGGDTIPYQITDIESNGISFWFSRVYNVRVPQATTSAAFDFTVFQ